MTKSIYSCWTDDPNKPRGGTKESWMQNGWRYLHRGTFVTREPVMVRIRTEFLEMKCGALKQEGYTDLNCIGCTNRSDE